MLFKIVVLHVSNKLAVSLDHPEIFPSFAYLTPLVFCSCDGVFNKRFLKHIHLLVKHKLFNTRVNK